MVGGISFFQEGVDGWVGPSLVGGLESCGLDSGGRWDEVVELLKGFMWIKLLHYRIAKKFFEAVRIQVKAVGELTLAYR